MRIRSYFIVSILMLTACAGGNADYGKAITDHLMSKAPAGKGYKVDILDLEQLAPVTVADSVAILRAAFEDDRKGNIEHTRGVLRLAQMLPEGSDRQNREMALGHTIDSLMNAPVPVFYEGVPADKVLAVPIRCRYSASVPEAPSTITETFDFWLSPDGKMVLYQRRSK